MSKKLSEMNKDELVDLLTKQYQANHGIQTTEPIENNVLNKNYKTFQEMVASSLGPKTGDQYMENLSNTLQEFSTAPNSAVRSVGSMPTDAYLKSMLSDVGTGKADYLDLAMANSGKPSSYLKPKVSFKQKQAMDINSVIQAAEQYRADNNIPKDNGVKETGTPSAEQRKAFEDTANKVVDHAESKSTSPKRTSQGIINPYAEMVEIGQDEARAVGIDPVVSSAESYIDEARKKLDSQRTSYSNDLDALIDQFRNRQAFSYDPSSDPLYQSYLAAMQNAGQLAMRDTMGQAAALTGGYGSSYATAAANGAYNQYLQKANEALPDYYQMAQNAYNAEGNNLLDSINLLRKADETEYNRYWDENERAYNRYWDEETRNYNREQSELEAYNKAIEASKTGFSTLKPSETKTIYADAIKNFGEGFEGGMTSLNAYIDSLNAYGFSDSEIDEILDYVDKHTPQSFKLIEAPDGTKKVLDKYGNAYTGVELMKIYKDDPEILQGILSLKEIGDVWKEY